MSVSNPIQSAYEKFEAAKLICVAKFERADEVYREVQAALGQRPERTWGDDETRAEVAKWEWWCAQRHRQVVARLGTDEDEYTKPHWHRMMRAQEDLADIQATTVDDLLCQVRAWWDVNEDLDENTSCEVLMMKRLQQDLERLVAPPPSAAEVVQLPARVPS